MSISTAMFNTDFPEGGFLDMICCRMGTFGKIKMPFHSAVKVPIAEAYSDVPTIGW